LVSVVGNILKEQKNKSKEPQKRTRAQALGGAIFLIFIICLNVFFIRFLYLSMTQVDTIPIRKIQIEGELDNLSKSQIEEYYLQKHKEFNLITLDLDETKEYMLNIPWINDVYLRKRHPDILMIHVVEHKPIAKYNDGILTSQWDVIYPDLSNFNKSFVNLYGPESEDEDPEVRTLRNKETAKVIYDRYRILNSVLSNSNFVIKKLVLTKQYIWIVELTNGIIVKLGREADTIDINMKEEDVLAYRLNLFVSSFPYIENQDLIEYVDMRYDNALAVKYKFIENQNDKQ
jgi:cell division protein FtsQ